MTYAQKRTRKFIDRSSQLLIGGQILLHSLLLIGLLVLLLFFEPFATMFSTYSAEDHLAVAREFVLLNSSKWPLLVLLALFTVAVSILFSHKLVGPVFKACQVLSQMNRRQLGGVVRFRRTDYFHALETELNQVVERWKGDIATVRDVQRSAQRLADELRQNPDSPEKRKELDNVLTELGELVRSYEGL